MQVVQVDYPSRAAHEEQRTGFECDRGFVDHGASGKLARRPELDAALGYARAGDVLVITKLDRLGRSVRNLVELAADLERRGIGLQVLSQGIDTTTPSGRLLFHMLAAIAEFERDLLVERTQEGLAAARARGRKGGRPSVLTPNKVATARQLIDAGELSITQIAEVVGCSRATVYRHPDLARVQVRTADPADTSAATDTSVGAR